MRAAVCGADGCVDATDQMSHAILDGGPTVLGPAALEPSFILRIEIGTGNRVEETLHTRWLPRSRLMRADDGSWIEPSSSARMAFARLTRGIEPLPPAAMGGERLAPKPPEEAGDGGGSAGIALAVAAPAALLLLLLVAARGRRRRS
jgi:hypothetical protein